MSNKEVIQETFTIVPFSKELAERFADDICKALDQIPEVEKHTLAVLLQEKKGDRILHKKWEHSFILLDDKTFVGVVIGYERDAENNEQYPYNTIYMNDLAVSEKYQGKGLGKFLVRTWLERNTQIGFLQLTGSPLRFSVQTNSAVWNAHVQNLYTSYGFQKIATKNYDNRVDNVYLLEVSKQ